MRRIITGGLSLVICGVSLAESLPGYKAGFIAQLPETQVELRRPGVSGQAPDSWAWLYPSPISNTVVIQQVNRSVDDPASSHVCFYLVKGYDGFAGRDDDPKALLSALKPENVLQFSCQREFVRDLPEWRPPSSGK